MDKNVLIAIAQGSEDMEFVIPADMLRRAGITVKVAGETDIITCSRGVKVIPDLLLEEIDDEEMFDALVIPGGNEGTNRLTINEYLYKIIKRHIEKGKIIASICAGPLVLHDNKFLPAGMSLTSHPSVSHILSSYNYLEDNVVIDGNFVTSRAAGTSFDFSLALVSLLAGQEAARTLAASVLIYNE